MQFQLLDICATLCAIWTTLVTIFLKSILLVVTSMFETWSVQVLRRFYEVVSIISKISVGSLVVNSDNRLSPSLSKTKLSELIQSALKRSSYSHSITSRTQQTKFLKFRHNVRDTINPSCPANDEVDDMEHTPLLCHWYYDGPRSDILHHVNAILLPHGLSSLSNEVLLEFIFYCNERFTI